MDEQSQIPTIPAEKRKKSIAWIIAALIIIVILVAVSMWQNSKTKVNDEAEEATPNEIGDLPTDSTEDTTPVINEDIDSIDINDLEQEFKDIDKDIESL
jgi:flagellar basal body-associated protein FliL